MKYLVIPALLVFGATSAHAQSKAELKTEKDSASYAVGVQIGQSVDATFKERGVTLDAGRLWKGVNDIYADTPEMKQQEVQTVLMWLQTGKGEKPGDAEVSYALGSNVASLMKGQQINVTPNNLAVGIIHRVQGEVVVPQETLDAVYARFEANIQKQQQERMAAAGAEAKEAGTKFLTENGKRDGVTTTKSGLQYEVMKQGTGASPAATDEVTVHYTGTLVDGSKFDSSYDRGEPVTFPLSGVIRGWTEGLQLMKEGAKYRFYIPYDLAYGAQGRPPQIPPYSTLIFDVELIKVGGK